MAQSHFENASHDDQIIEDVRAANDIVEVLSQYITLKHSGREFKACCPFHQEKTPSFFVSREKQMFYCFGCGAGGSVFTFLMRHENMTFPESLKMLAERAHITLPERKFTKKEDAVKEPLYDACEEAANFYHDLLLKPSGIVARDYLAKRKISNEIIKEFRLGWATQEWGALVNAMTVRGYSMETLQKAALVQKSAKGNLYDTFHGRLVFPIQNLSGKVIAFGGRVMGDEPGPKYLNSPETAIFSKRRELFGLYQAKKHISREWPNLILVEGYMDFLALYQHGFKNTVATLGTALGEDHVRIMRRFVEEVIVVYDGDKAGESASLRGLEILLEGGMQVKLVHLPDGLDPDDFLNKYGNDVFARELKTAKDFFDYKLVSLLKRFPQKDALGVSKITREMIDTLRKVKDAVRLSEYIKRLSTALKIDEAVLKKEFRVFAANSSQKDFQEAPKTLIKVAPKTPALKREWLLLLLMTEVPPFCDTASKEIKREDLQNLDSQNIFDYLTQTNLRGGKSSVLEVSEKISDESYRKGFMETSLTVDEFTDRETAFMDCVKAIQRSALEKEIKEYSAKIAQAESSGDKEKSHELMKEYNERMLKLKTLKKVAENNRF